MGEGPADHLAPGHHRGEAREVGMCPPPVAAELERHARAQEEHPAPVRPAEQVPEGLHPVAAYDLVRGRPVSQPRPQRERGLARAGRRAGEGDARRQPQHHRDPRRGPRRIPPIARDARPHEPRHRGGGAQDQGEQARVHEPIGGKPEQTRELPPERTHAVEALRQDANGRGQGGGTVGQAAVEEARYRRRMGEGPADHLAPGHHRGEAREVGMCPPPEMCHERQKPERGDPETCAEDQRDFAPPGAPPTRSAEARQQHQEQRGRQVGGVRQDHRRHQERGPHPGPPRTLQPWQQREREERQQAPAQPRGHEAPAQALLDSAARLRRDGEHEEGAGQREPARSEHPTEEEIRAGSRQEEDEPHEAEIDRARAQEAERHVMHERPQIEEARGIVLQLRIPRPPAGVPVPGGGTKGDDVNETVELPGMVVAAGDAATQRRPSPRDGVSGEHDRRHEQAEEHG